MYGKRKRIICDDEKIMLAFPGGAGYGEPKNRDAASVKRDLARGYISAETARNEYALSESDIESVLAAAKNGEDIK